MGSMGTSHGARIAAAMATSVAPAAMRAEQLGNAADGLPESMTLLQKHTLLVRERRRLQRQQYWRSVRIQVHPSPVATPCISPDACPLSNGPIAFKPQSSRHAHRVNAAGLLCDGGGGRRRSRSVL